MKIYYYQIQRDRYFEYCEIEANNLDHARQIAQRRAKRIKGKLNECREADKPSINK